MQQKIVVESICFDSDALRLVRALTRRGLSVSAKRQASGWQVCADGDLRQPVPRAVAPIPPSEIVAAPGLVKLDNTGEELPEEAAGHDAILDNSTGLTWSGTLPCGEVNHADAVQACADLRLLGQSDWRLPMRKELLSLVDDTRREPAIDVAFFGDCESSRYWSSSAVAGYPGFAWGVDFGDGDSYGDLLRGGSAFVRAVRGPVARSGQ